MEQEWKYCPSCGAANNVKNPFCVGCGSKFEDAASPEQAALAAEPPPAKKKGRGKWIVIGAIVLIGACGICAVVGMMAGLLGDGELTDVVEATARPSAIPTLMGIKTLPPAESQASDEPVATEVPRPTDTPEPTEAPEAEGLVQKGTHLVGTDMQPGIYVGQAGEDMVLGSCYWARLSGVTGDLDDVLANDNAIGLYYLEVLPGDMALKTDCELLPIEQVPARGELLTDLRPGTYLVGRDIGPGMYRGQAGADVLDSCYWSRLSGVSGDMGEILANENATGQYFIEVLPSDFALKVGCEAQKAQ